MVGQIYPTGLQLNTANSSDTEAPFWDLNLSNNKWHSFFSKIHVNHTGKCIRQFAGIYAYCLFFIDWTW